jgi:coenzyme F420-dependent glucose-6-phosphate dehydrogenase
MARIAYHISHEQFAPSVLLDYAAKAEQAGFDAIHSSDHFHPWNRQQGESGFSFAWLGAAMQVSSLPFGLVCAPGQRYHPAIVAQAIATLAEMFPDRLWVALGSGEALNEYITGDGWPVKAVRNRRLRECYEIIRQLLAGETVTHRGTVKVESARLYTLPSKKPLLIGAAVTKETAFWMGQWADGLITINKPRDELEEVVGAFRKGGGEGKPLFLKIQLSYDRNPDKALMGAHQQWRTNIIDNDLLADLWKPAQFEAAAKFVQPEDLREMVRVSHEPEQHLSWIRQDIALGFSTIILHNVNRNQETFIHDFGEEVLPALRK